MLPKSFLIAVFLAVAIAPAMSTDRTQVLPAPTLFTHSDDVQMGQRLADDLESQLRLLNDSGANAYINSLGKDLAGRVSGESFDYIFKILDDDSFNTFALPGGFIYVNRGVIESAQNQSQLAGILAHQIAHVALRHGSSL